jgi:hypothetical protein
MKRIFRPTIFLLTAGPLLPFFAGSETALLHAQGAPAVYYAQSFRQGPTRITEQSFEAQLDPQNPVYRQRIKDAHGADRYVFTLAPQGPQGDNKITSWQAKLADLHHAIYDNILLASQAPSSDPANNLWRLEPRNFPAVPVGAQRVIKVDSFYVTLQVKSYHFTPIDSPYLDSMAVQVKFSNTDPRSPGP